MKQCQKNLYNSDEKKQKTLTFDKKSDGSGSNLVATIFNKEACRMACAKMIILDELPFSFVEGHGFRHFCSVACLKFDPLSRRTIVRDIYQLYLDEKLALRLMFVANQQRVSLTTDTWTSIQNVCYMSLTGHYIDDDWMLHKRILNFCVVPNHKGEAIGKLIEVCLHDWGIEKVFTLTLDNASANNNVIAYLKRKMVHWKNCILNADFLHIRCSAHIVNLIVCEGLKELDETIASIRNVVRYVRSSPSRLQKFKECLSQEKIDSKSLVCLDVLTRWNSTYLMLESALKFQKAFERMEEEDGHYASYFGEDDSGRKKVEPPLAWHWDDAKVFVQFLKGFYDVTLKFSVSLYVSSNIYFHQVSSIQKQLNCF
ncbi:zinc finger BED domain-containing protein RICESLEEPER 2-like [Ziziphus jujuba]|uniref:Zinc finger BED domain-containing protein RICESLEEPER 2-like n=1 Tax=Ziziphus jujuba TaxID=326968 RepID=A0ABM3I8H8_ZIZJJ|nr:zinc finger BED domain-containing protein RICESLEEPER 2-like [Ziziphus jujuba]XP_048323253.2 zinc finger BED domain-containing protein RICESLEEPER 2-like [Ziziphus jujuba]XP_060669786.1 zinc finger BED domain-containing protein RICESLEEPER 2-like [Ziziphus jujuba]